MPTVLTDDRHAVVEPFLFNMQRGQDPIYGTDRPMPTVTASSSDFAVAQPFVLSMEHSQGKFVLPVNHGKDNRTYSVERPMPTVTTVDAWAMVQAYLVKFYGTGGATSVDEPLDTVTTKDRFGLVEIYPGTFIDIHFRMLHWRELAAAQSFPADYEFCGNREEIVRQVGNAVPVRTAKALCHTLLGG